MSYKGDSFISCCILDEQNIYFAMTASENQGSHAYVASVDFLSGGEPVVMEQGEGWIASLFMDPQGNLWCVRTVPETRDKPVEWYLEKVGLGGAATVSLDISEYMQGASGVSDGGIDENGNCYLLAGEWGAFDLKVFNSAGECIRTVEDIGDVTYLDIWEGEGVLLYGYSGNAQLFTMQTQFLEPIQEISNSGDLKLASQKDGNVFFVNNSNLMCYDANTKESVKVLNITDINTMTNYVQDVCTLEDGRIALLIQDWNVVNQLEVVCLKKVPRSEIPEKKIIRLGTLNAMAGSDLEAAMVNFNKASSEYKIEVVDYFTSDWVTGIQKLNQEIAAGNAPDLIDLRLIEENLYSCQEKGVLEDSGLYLDASDKVSREDFLPNLLDAYTQYHILYAIPADFQIKTVIGKSSELGNASIQIVQRRILMKNS